MNEYLRKKCKLIKAFNNITYKQIARDTGINEDSFYNWIRGKYNLGVQKQKILYDYVKKMRPEEELL